MIISIFTLFISSIFASDTTHWMKLDAQDKFERSKIADVGVDIEVVNEDYVVAMGTEAEFQTLSKMGMVIQSFKTDEKIFDFPERDRNFHNYAEMQAYMNDLQTRFPALMKIENIGSSLEGRTIFNMRISSNLETSNQKPAIVFMGAHHAREHLSSEMPLMLAKYLLENYATDPKIHAFLDSREIHIIPVVNPDGAEYDISGGTYKSWRKNRRHNADGTYGVDLNRNYGYQWGTGGSSHSGNSETYMGTTPFSEPETQVIKNFVESRQNINVLLTLHTFSELVLYPWGHSYDSISNHRDMLVHKTMAEKMATWNHYTPEQASELYIASGDTTDWAYGTQGVISFTFELDPKSMFGGGFYPGQAVIDNVFQKNLPAFLYLIEYTDNPYRTIESNASANGFQSELF